MESGHRRSDRTTTVIGLAATCAIVTTGSGTTGVGGTRSIASASVRALRTRGADAAVLPRGGTALAGVFVAADTRGATRLTVLFFTAALATGVAGVAGSSIVAGGRGFTRGARAGLGMSV